MEEKELDYIRELYDHLPEPLPDWAIGKLNGELVLGAQLCTRDGRRTGNAHIIGITNSKYDGSELFLVLTDAGTKMACSRGEVEYFFYPPKYRSNVEEVLRKFQRRER